MNNKTNNNEISSTSLEEHIQLESIDKDIQDIVNKYAKDRMNISSYGEIAKNHKGFFLMWVKKDEDLPENERIQITTFAQFINSEEVIASMDKVLRDMALEQKMPINVA